MDKSRNSRNTSVQFPKDVQTSQTSIFSIYSFPRKNYQSISSDVYFALSQISWGQKEPPK